MKKLLINTVKRFSFVLGLVLSFTYGVDAQQVVGKITPDSIWIPCGATQTVNLMFSSTNGVSVSNFNNTSQLIPYLRNGLVAWYPFYGGGTPGLSDRSMNGNDFITSSPLTPSFLGMSPFPNTPNYSADRFVTTPSQSYWLHLRG